MSENFKLEYKGKKIKSSKLIIRDMDLKSVSDELVELVDLLVQNDSYLKGKLKDKEVGSNSNVDDLKKGIEENKNNKVVRELLERELANHGKDRFDELMKRYGKLLFNEGVLRRNGLMNNKEKYMVFNVKKSDIKTKSGLEKIKKDIVKSIDDKISKTKDE